jgi:hypothetical protein
MCRPFPDISETTVPKVEEKAVFSSERRCPGEISKSRIDRRVVFVAVISDVMPVGTSNFVEMNEMKKNVADFGSRVDPNGVGDRTEGYKSVPRQCRHNYAGEEVVLNLVLC